MKFSFDDFSKWFEMGYDETLPELYKLIGMLLDPNPWIRLSLGEFMAILSPYKEQILEMNEFRLDPKVTRSVLTQYLK